MRTLAAATVAGKEVREPGETCRVAAFGEEQINGDIRVPRIRKRDAEFAAQ
jgi:hypothetical protein